MLGLYLVIRARTGKDIGFKLCSHSHMKGMSGISIHIGQRIKLAAQRDVKLFLRIDIESHFYAPDTGNLCGQLPDYR